MSFAKNPKSPSFVLGTAVISIDKLTEWADGEGSQYVTDYKGTRQIRLQILQGKDKVNFVVDTWKPTKPANEVPELDSGDLPF